ncbi:MAG: rhomboid family intramembrane serine protease [Anaerolineae bacterium]|nr:rhomboid family intramembrane serine protease [Anaerolineae bacterium]
MHHQSRTPARTPPPGKIVMHDAQPPALQYQDTFTPPRYSLPLFPVRLTYVLIAINGLVFITDNLLNRWVFSLGALAPGLVLQYNQWWRLLSAGFVHADLLHVGVNLYALYNLGILVERFFGPLRYLGLYFLSLFGANVLVTLFTPLNVPTVGASGAIMGLLGAALVYFWRYRNLLPQGRRYLNELIRMAVINIGIGLLPGISLWGHLGGLLAGSAVGWILMPYYRAVGEEVRVLRIQPLQQHAWIYTLVVFSLMVGFVFLAVGWRVG